MIRVKVPIPSQILEPSLVRYEEEKKKKEIKVERKEASGDMR